MKKKLFAVAIVLSLYTFFILIFTMADNEGLVSQILSNVGLINASAIASPSLGQDKLLNHGILLKENLIDPIPDPSTPRPPRPPDMVEGHEVVN